MSPVRRVSAAQRDRISLRHEGIQPLRARPFSREGKSERRPWEVEFAFSDIGQNTCILENYCYLCFMGLNTKGINRTCN